jgi:site-specific DNA recombinase
MSASASLRSFRWNNPGPSTLPPSSHIPARREELEALLAGTKEEPVLLHPNMAAHYRRQVANLAQVLNREENRAEAADILRSLVDRIELMPNQQGKLEIDL